VGKEGHVVERMRRVSGSQLVYTELRRRILEHRLRPGQRLYEPELAAELAVSRTPLREALRLLLAEDLLDQLPTGGMVVRAMSADEIRELYGVRAALEGLMAATAAQRIDAVGAEGLRALLARNERLVELPEEAMNAGHEFHLRVGEIARHGWAARLHEQVDSQMARYRMFTNQTQERRRAALAEHRAILEAILGQDAEEARRLAEEHVLRARGAAVAATQSRLERLETVE
jgi:DNA-binding GntR family transcriptional regulator